MLVKPNRTVLLGKVMAIRPEPDGFGAGIELAISENRSAEGNLDFIKTKPGEVVELFFTEPNKLKIGDTIQANASLSAGPFGGRAVIEEMRKVSPK